MTREEKEEAYNKARERIFGTASTEVSTPGMSLPCSMAFPWLTLRQRTKTVLACLGQVLFPYGIKTMAVRRQEGGATRILSRPGPTTFLMHQRMGPLTNRLGSNRNMSQRTLNSMATFSSSNIRLPCHQCMVPQTSLTPLWRPVAGMVCNITTCQTFVVHRTCIYVCSIKMTNASLVSSAAWTTPLSTCYELGSSRALRCPCAVIASTATRLAATTAADPGVQPKPLPVPGYSSGANRDTLCLWRSSGQH